MNPLYQRLRELDSETFENLCFQIIAERHPGMKIERVRGVGGDKGVDIFSGDLSGRPAIWQCKFFANGIKSAQKIQIKKSLRVALQNFTPRKWILCVPLDLDINAHAWFQSLTKEYSSRLEIGLFQASNIVRELLHRRSIRNQFFPGAVLDADEIRSVLARTGEYSTTEISRLNLENVQQYLRRLKDRDARFDYQITFLPEQATEFDNRGQIVSIGDQDQRLDVFARDIEALKLDPPKIVLSLETAASEKLRQAIETGSGAHFTPTEVRGIRSTFDFLLPDGYAPEAREVWITPHTPKDKRLIFRVTFGTPEQGITYSLIEFRVLRSGTKEIELGTSSTNLPFEMKLALKHPLNPSGGGGSMNISYLFAGHTILAIKKFVDALAALERCSDVLFFDVERDRLAFKCELQLTPELILPEEFRAPISKLATIANTFDPELRLPTSLEQGDFGALPTYLDLATKGHVVLDVNKVSMTVIKDSSRRENFLEAIKQEGTFRLDFENYDGLPPLLKRQIKVGPCSLFFERTRVADPEKVLRDYATAEDGDGVVVELVPMGQVKLISQRVAPQSPSLSAP